MSLNLTSLDWPRADIMLVSLSHGEKLDMSENILLGGYTEDKSQMVLVKIFGEFVDSDQKVILAGSLDLGNSYYLGNKVTRVIEFVV